jgi:hypothetical protein
MTNHADDRAVQEASANAIQNIVWGSNRYDCYGNVLLNVNRIALAKAAGLVPLLQHAAGMGIEAATTQLGLLGECGEEEAEEKRRERVRYVFCGEMAPPHYFVGRL